MIFIEPIVLIDTNGAKFLKAVAIIASPIKNGIISRLTERVLDGLSANGHDIQKVFLYDYRIDYCKGCWQCSNQNRCILEDDFNQIFNIVKTADILILSSPTYWSNVSGIMKSFFDRQCGMAMKCIDSKEVTKEVMGIKIPIGYGPREEIKNKKCVFITSCMVPFPFNYLMGETSGILGAMYHYSRKIKAKVVGKIIFSDTKFLNASNNVNNKLSRYLKRAYRLGRYIK